MWRICMELFFINNIFRSKNLNYQNPKIIFRHRQEYYTVLKVDGGPNPQKRWRLVKGPWELRRLLSKCYMLEPPTLPAKMWPTFIPLLRSEWQGIYRIEDLRPPSRRPQTGLVVGLGLRNTSVSRGWWMKVNASNVLFFKYPWSLWG